MIKITKPVQKEFHGFCKWCGCEFTYEISDLKLSATSDKVSCPTCGKDYHHNMMVQDPTIPGGIGRLQTWPPEPIPTITPDMTNIDPCAGCTWRAELLAKGSYVGDTPCDFCGKNPNKVTCLQTSISTADYPKAVYGISKTEVYKTPCDVECGVDYACSTTSKEVPGTYTTAYNCSDDVANGEVMTTIMECCSNSLNKCGDTEGCNSCSGEHNCGGKKNCKGKH